MTEPKRLLDPHVQEARKYWPRLSVLPSSNWQLVVGSVLFGATILNINIMLWTPFAEGLNEWLLVTIFGAELTFAGIATWQHTSKRKTDPKYMSGQAAVEAAKAGNSETAAALASQLTGEHQAANPGGTP